MSKPQKYRALGRKILAEFPIDEESAVPRGHLHSRAHGQLPVPMGSREIVDTH